MIRAILSSSCMLVIACTIFPADSHGLPQEDFVVPPPGQTQIITTSDGSTTIGRITEITDTGITFSTEMGTITIPYGMVTSIRTVPSRNIKNGAYWHEDPNATRLYFAPTGRMLEKGGGYIADYYLFFPSFNYGVTSRLSPSFIAGL